MAKNLNALKAKIKSVAKSNWFELSEIIEVKPTKTMSVASVIISFLCIT